MIGTSDDTFAWLRRLADSFAALAPADGDAADSPMSLRVARRLLGRLGTLALPLLVRELCGADDARRRWARVLLFEASTFCERRVVAELETIVGRSGSGGIDDTAKIAALGMLRELGITRVDAEFVDPERVQRRSAAQLAAQLDTPADVASAAELMIRQLSHDDLFAIVEAMFADAESQARRLVTELLGRLDLELAVRAELRRRSASLWISKPAENSKDKPVKRSSKARARPSMLVILGNNDGRTVVAISKRVAGEDRCRTWAVLIDECGCLQDCAYDDDAAPSSLTRDIVAPLTADGYRPRAARLAIARAAVERAIVAAVAASVELPSSYYLGRDLLELGDAHVQVGARDPAAPPPTIQRAPIELATIHGRAVDLLAASNAGAALPLLAHCAQLAPDDADIRAHLGHCLLELGELEAAREQFAHAQRLAPSHAMHHWNLAAAAHRGGRLDECYLALRQFLTARDVTRTPKALATRSRTGNSVISPSAEDHAALDRRVIAANFVDEYERDAQLRGVALPSPVNGDNATGVVAPTKRTAKTRRAPMRAARRPSQTDSPPSA